MVCPGGRGGLLGTTHRLQPCVRVLMAACSKSSESNTCAEFLSHEAGTADTPTHKLEAKRVHSSSSLLSHEAGTADTPTLSQEYKLEGTRVQSSSSLLSHEAEQQTHPRSLRSTSWREHVCIVPPLSSHMKLNSRHTHALSGVQAGGNTCA